MAVPLPIASAKQPAPVEIQQAIRFREGFGLQADRSYVERAAADGLRFPSLDYGVPLTSAEAAELNRRAEVQLALGPARE